MCISDHTHDFHLLSDAFQNSSDLLIAFDEPKFSILESLLASKLLDKLTGLLEVVSW